MYKLPKDLQDSFLERDIVAIIGSGPSTAAGFPTWKLLIELLIRECEQNLTNFKDGDEYNDLLKKGLYPEVANECRKLLGASLYSKFIRKIFCDTSIKPTNIHTKIVELPLCSILTTNYDKLIELAYLKIKGNSCLPTVYTQKNILQIPNLASEKRFFILKLHGDVDDINSIILTDKDYQELIHDNQAYHFALSTIFANRTLVFIGYSLSDPDLNHIFSEQISLFKGFGKRHYAFIADSNRIYSNILYDKYNISVIPYSSAENHLELGIILNTLIYKINKSGPVKEKSREKDLKTISTLQSQLLQAQKLEAIGTLAGGIAHDFNNLLTAINGCTDMALLKINEKNEIFPLLKDISYAANRASDLTRQLLAFSRQNPIEFQFVNINKILENLLKMMERIIGENITLEEELEQNLLTVKADSSSIEQVILNLTVNARDAMPSGGRIKIKTENVKLDEIKPDQLENSGTNTFVRLSFIDNGTGIEEKIMSHIFEPFFSTKGPNKGTGLGLSVVYGIIKQHNGWINVQSKSNKGTTFEIFIPAYDKKISRPQKIRPSLKEIVGNGEAILIVEDATGVREFVERALKENNYKTYSAKNVTKAINIFKKEHIDLVFSDVVLPDRSGLDLVENILVINPDMKIILTSGYTDIKSQWPLIHSKGIPFLQKPYTFHELLGIIKDAL